jgi:hypothetical protein
MNPENFEIIQLIKKVESRVPLRIKESGEAVSFTDILRLIKLVDEDGDTPIHRSIIQILFRFLEVGLLSHPNLLRLSDVWDSIIGYAEERIAENLKQILNEEPPDFLISHVYNCLSGDTVRYNRPDVNLINFIDRLFDQAASYSVSKELRCRTCGFHFRVSDLINETNKQRAKKATKKGLILANTLYPGRSSDPFKPIQIGEKSMTCLTVDHIIPRETLGWSSHENLEILCGFCNFGKAAYRWPLEAISQFAVGGLCDFPIGRSFSTLKGIIVVASLRAQSGICCSCGKSKDEVEMTVRPVENMSPNSYHGFSPWNLRTICYPCLFLEEQ